MDQLRSKFAVLRFTLVPVLAAVALLGSTDPPLGRTRVGPVSHEPGGSTVEPSFPESEVLLGSLASQHGTNEIGPIPVTSERISVYVRCVGVGSVDVNVAGVASFPNDCSPNATDLGIQNTLDVRFVDEFTVRVSGENVLTWAVAVTIPR